MADNTGSEFVVTPMPEDEPALQVDEVNYLNLTKLYMPDSEDDTVKPCLNQDILNMDTDQTIHMPEGESDRLIDDTSGPVNEENTNCDATNVEHGGGTLEDKKKLQWTRKVLKTILNLFIILLVCGGIGAGFYHMVRKNEVTRAELQLKMEGLSAAWNNTKVLEEETRDLRLLLNSSLDSTTIWSDRMRKLSLVLQEEQQSSVQLSEQNQRLRSILFSDQLSFIWGFCNETTLKCSRCPPGWKEHNSRCFHISEYEKKWHDGRKVCRDYGGDFAVVLDDEDQIFLTNMAHDFSQQHPNNIPLAWIGLSYMVSWGRYEWIDGRRLDVKYWRDLASNNPTLNRKSGRACVAIVTLKSPGHDTLNNWYTFRCARTQNFICETKVLNLS